MSLTPWASPVRHASACTVPAPSENASPGAVVSRGDGDVCLVWLSVVSDGAQEGLRLDAGVNFAVWLVHLADPGTLGRGRILVVLSDLI